MATWTHRYRTDGKFIWSKNGTQWLIYNVGACFFAARRVTKWNEGQPIVVNRVTSFRKLDVQIVSSQEN